MTEEEKKYLDCYDQVLVAFRSATSKDDLKQKAETELKPAFTIIGKMYQQDMTKYHALPFLRASYEYYKRLLPNI